MIYYIIKHVHSGLRWILVSAILIILFNSVSALLKEKKYSTIHKKILSSAFGLYHLQIIFGLILYLISPKVNFSSAAFSNPVQRFFLIEHITGMILSLFIFWIGFSRIKKLKTDQQKFQAQLIYIGISFLILLATIPWPFFGYGSMWI